jgi:sortase A
VPRPLTNHERRPPAGTSAELPGPGRTPISVLDRPEVSDDVVPRPAASHAVAAPGLRPRTRMSSLELQAVGAEVLLAFSAMMIGFFGFVVFLSALPQERAQTGLERRLRTTLHNAKAAIGGPIPAGTPVARLDIARIGVHQVVVEGTGVDQLRKGPGHLPVSPLPGQVGNAVIGGHRVAWGGPFDSLHSLRTGDVIHVVTGQGPFTYHVTGSKTVSHTDVGPLKASADNRLTLVTAANLSGSRRLVVVALLDGQPQPAPAGRPSVLSATQGGLVGNDGALPALGLWVEALVLAAAATVVVYRRLPRWSSYLITTPVVLAALWLVYANLSRLLPATQ